ncbi:MAG: LysM peptidoglycan-binding domain-containing protein [Chitinophagaceae bacterium]|nr:MAG: LysM peptidoglycan-binding domain-containing protein [Chitinophagaceae bacterium]
MIASFPLKRNPISLKIILLFGVTIFTLASCKSRQYSRNNRQIEKEAIKQTPNFTIYSTIAYIEKFKGVAIEEMNAYGIPASITLAQGILESSSGNSSLAKYANNHFGIKCTSDWKGKAYYKDDDQNNDCFRVYKDAKESFKDHSTFLKRKRYSFLFELDKNDYKNWALGLKTAGYATNPKYPDLLINLIERYKLNQYDQSETEREKINREDRVFTEINANIPLENKKFTPVAVAPKDPPQGTEAPNDGYYTVKQGDTLFKIAQLYKLTVDELKALNKLADNNIKIGQKLLIVK